MGRGESTDESEKARNLIRGGGHSLDDLAVPYEDLEHPERFVLIGMSLRSNLLLVVFAERAGGETIRIISARRATRRERRAYEEGH